MMIQANQPGLKLADASMTVSAFCATMNVSSLVVQENQFHRGPRGQMLDLGGDVQQAIRL